MIDIKTISKELAGTVGLYSTMNQGDWLPAHYHRSPVVFLSDAHKLLRPEVLNDLGPLFSGYFGTRTGVNNDNQPPYNLYDIVQPDTPDLICYESLEDDNTAELTDETKWRKTTLLSAWYSRIERGAIAKVCLGVTGNPPPKPLLDRQPLYQGEGNLRDSINRLNNRFLGLAFRISRRNVALGVIRLGLQVTGPLTNFPVYIFHSSSDQPIAIARLTGTTTGRTIWVDVNEYLFDRVGGYYMIGYFEQDLPSGVFAVGATRAFTLEGCSGCMGSNYGLVEQRINYVQIAPFYVSGLTTTGTLSWTQSDEIQIGSQSYGLNLILDAKCDATQQLIDNKDMLTNALLYTVACDMLEEIAHSDRVNSVAAELKSAAYVALVGQGESSMDIGLKKDRNDAMKTLKEALSALSPLCMQKEAPRGITFGSVFD